MYNKVEKIFCEYCVKIINWDEVVFVFDVKNVVIIFSCLVFVCEDRIKEFICGEDFFEGFDGQKVLFMGMKLFCIFFEQLEGLVKGEIKCLNLECGCFVEFFCMFGCFY